MHGAYRPRMLEDVKMKAAPMMTEKEVKAHESTYSGAFRRVLERLSAKEYVALACIVASQVIAVCMNTVAKILESPGPYQINPLQVLNVRMIITLVICQIFGGSWTTSRKGTPDVATSRRLWRLLILRSISGTVAAIGFYYSLLYLQLNESAVLFLFAPLGAFCTVKWITRSPFSTKECLAITASAFGAVLVVRPDLLSTFKSNPALRESMSGKGIGVAVAIVGATGGSLAYTSIQLMGPELNVVTSVKSFALSAVFFSSLIQAVSPGSQFSFRFDLHAVDWVMSITVGVFGCLMENLLARGLSLDPSPRTTQAIYIQPFLAMIFDWLVWSKPPGVVAIFGAILVTGSTLVLLAGSPKKDDRNEKNAEMSEHGGIFEDDRRRSDTLEEMSGMGL